MSVLTAEAGEVINGCLNFTFISKHFYVLYFALDLLKKRFEKKTMNLVFLAEKISSKELFVLKMIDIGDEGSDQQKKSQKDAANEINIGITVGQKSPFLVRYVEKFYHKYFCCLVLEYCEGGDLQTQLDENHEYSEDVYLVVIFTFHYIAYFIGT
jgi:serine/threonine protein kinase